MSMEDKDVEQDWIDSLRNDPFAKEFTKDMETIQNVLEWIKEDGFGLEQEVIYWALKEMKENPSLTIGEAILHGFNEWDK